MITASNAFRAAMLAPIKQIGASVVSGNTIYAQDDVLQSVVIKTAGYYYGARTKLATIKLLGVDYSLVGQTLDVKQLAVTNMATNTWESIPQGRFIVSDQEIDLEKEITTIQAQDMMGVLGGTQYSTEDGITFPCTVANLALQIATRFNLRLVTDFATLPNSDHVIREDLYAKISGATYRDIIAEIAGATATLALIDEEDGLEFRALERNSLDNWTFADLIKLKIAPKYGPVNSVVLARTPQEDNIALQDTESVLRDGLTELKLANNEILDDDRQTLITPILNASKGFWFDPVSATTTGHGWHEVGDRIMVVDNSGNTYETVVTDTTLTLDGGIKEVINSCAPEETQTNYAMAGGITKTIYNTEIKVDKQGQSIESVVSKQDTIEGEMNANFTQIVQDLTSVITAVQNSGGNNLIKNSVGYVLTPDGKPEQWNTTIANGGALTVMASSEATIQGSISNNIMVLNGVKLRQRVSVVASDDSSEPTKYTFSVKLKKTVARGSGYIRITDGINEYRIDLASEDEPYYKEYSIKGIIPRNNYLDIEISGSEGSDFTITDAMLATGDYVAQWTQANGEFANVQVSIDVNGVKVKSSTLSGTYSQQTPLGFSGASGTKSYKLDSDSVASDKAIIETEIDLPPLKVISRSNGWAIVKKEI